MSEDKACREAFEAWVAASGRSHLLERDKPHRWYKDLTVTAWWAAWSACWSRAAKPAVPEGLVELLRDIRPKYGDVGSRDVDVAEQQRKIDAAIAMLSAAPTPPDTAKGVA